MNALNKAAKRILLVSGDPDLAQPRALLLRDAGHEVTQADDRGAAERAIAAGDFDVLVLCQTVAAEVGIAVTAAFRRVNPAAKVVAVVADLFLSIRADRVVPALDGPHALLAAIEQL